MASLPPPVQLFDTHLAQDLAQQKELTIYSYALVGLVEVLW